MAFAFSNIKPLNPKCRELYFQFQNPRLKSTMADQNPLSTSSAAKSRVSPATVDRAVKSLLKWRSSKSELQNPRLLEDDEFVYLIVTLKKIPARDRVNSYKIPLPHSLFDPSSAEVCLFVDDRPKSGLTKDAAAKKIDAESIPVSKVIKFTKLKSDYKAFEAKRKLCDSFDAFFADRRVVTLLPKLLGKSFFDKKKIPVPVDLRHKNWKEQIETALGSARLFLRTGTCSVVRVARVSMTPEEVAANVAAAIEGIAAVVPKKWANVRSFHLKLSESVALPVYQALPVSRLRIEGTLTAGTDQVEKTLKTEKKVKKKPIKGRIHEVQYMDSGSDEIDDDGGDDDDVAEKEMEVEVEAAEKKKKKSEAKRKLKSEGINLKAKKKSKRLVE